VICFAEATSRIRLGPSTNCPSGALNFLKITQLFTNKSVENLTLVRKVVRNFSVSANSDYQTVYKHEKSYAPRD